NHITTDVYPLSLHDALPISGQANHLGVTIEADIIKQKLPDCNGGFTALNFGKTDKRVYANLTSDHPIDLTRYQVVAGEIRIDPRSEEHTSELQSRENLVCRL